MRDAFLDRSRADSDIDIATDARPDVIEQVVKGWADAVWLQGERFGTVGAEKNGERLEITTFRAEIYRDDSRKPEVTFSDDVNVDLSRRDFTINAIARPLAGGEHVDPFDGRADLDARTLRAVQAGVFESDPLRLLRAVRFEEELQLTIERRTERLIREQARLVTRPAGERTLEVLRRLGVAGWHRLDELGLLGPLGGSLDLADRADSVDSPDYRLVVFLQDSLGLLPISRELRRYAVALLRSSPPPDSSPRSLHRFRRVTEPWAGEALAFHGRLDLGPAVKG